MKKFIRFPLTFTQWILFFSSLLLVNQNLSGGVENSQDTASKALQIKSDLAGLASSQMQIRTFSEGGRFIDEVIISGRPPLIYRAAAAVVAESDSAAGVKLLTSVPAFNWTYGCSATSAGMMMGYYDNHGYPNIYTGPTNGGVCPMNNETYWGTTTWPSITCGECPLVATHLGKDGRLTRGHVDDYWIDSKNAGSDPYLVNGWPEHAAGECTGDFMGTNQSKFGNADGCTSFHYYNDGSPCYDYTGGEPGSRDGGHGLRLFAESRGYTVTANFSQYIFGHNGNTLGFTFEDFKEEIDAGRPVLIHVTNHTMLGFGYDTSSSSIYIHDTWDHSDHTMTWGGSYSGLQHYGVTVLRLASSFPTITGITPNSGHNGGPINITNLAGTNFQSGARVKLTRTGQADIAATDVIVDNATRIRCILNLSGAAIGLWKIVVTNPNEEFATLANGFTVGQFLYYVSPTGNDSNTGYSWSAARKTVTAGLNAAMTGGQVWVAKGTYNERITLKAGVGLYGGFAGTETQLSQRNWTVNVTILDGNQGGSVVTSPSGADNATRIDGFTLCNGNSSNGGGIYCYSSSPTIANNTISGNSATNGGGIYGYSSSPTIVGNTIGGNTASDGAGIFCYSSSPTIANNTIRGNTAASFCGGIYCYYSSPILANNTIIGNTAATSGGGILCYSSSPTIVNNTIGGNSVNYVGGGIYSYLSSPTIANNIVAFNTSGIYKEGTSGIPVLRKNCVYNPGGDNYSGVDLSPGAGDISLDPLFVNRLAGNWHLSAASHCINAGNDADIQAGCLDMDGQSRIAGPHVDIGADEYYIPGDANGDGKVDVSDLGILAANYGGTGKTWALGDFSGDGKVDVSDLGILAANYGQGSGGATGAGDLQRDMKALGLSVDGDTCTPAEPQKTQTNENPVAKTLGGCGSAGLPLLAGILLAALCLMGLKVKD